MLVFLQDQDSGVKLNRLPVHCAVCLASIPQEQVLSTPLLSKKRGPWPVQRAWLIPGHPEAMGPGWDHPPASHPSAMTASSWTGESRIWEGRPLPAVDLALSAGVGVPWRPGCHQPGPGAWQPSSASSQGLSFSLTHQPLPWDQRTTSTNVLNLAVVASGI